MPSHSTSKSPETRAKDKAVRLGVAVFQLPPNDSQIKTLVISRRVETTSYSSEQCLDTRMRADMSKKSTIANVKLEDLWEALDALEAIPTAKDTDLYKRLEQAAEAATQVMALEKGLVERH